MRDFPFYVLQKGWARAGNGRGLSLVSLASFKGWTDSTTAARMSGRHWTNLIN